MIDRDDKILLGNHLHRLTNPELQTLHEILEYEWVFDDASPICEKLMADIEKEQIGRRRMDIHRLADGDRRALRFMDEDWEQILRPILVDAGMTIVEIGAYEHSKYRTDGTSG